MTERNASDGTPGNVVRGEVIILQLDPAELLSEPPTDAEFVGVLLSSTEGRPSYFAGHRIGGEAYDRVSMKFSDRERVWVKVADSGPDVTYRLITANQYATSRP
ncbi:hypothetical protein [Curtobacterium sp. MCBD17_019]|uniref:hypothetical protein n=1 Tax=Curtobacterium sp. MCBD17_019 TaxID=2175669 RepID=UPI000DA9680C|nr:hypothetical protein [Curtobacterium sp. MCBD17_019]PZE77673.1 hypothetical protein DEI82_02320 [Curtobacterium sp. MCBD17_019]